MLLTLTLLLGMLPAAAFASGTQVLPKDADYKGFSMEDMSNHQWVPYDKYSDQETLFFAPVYLSKGQGWTKLTFTIELSQYVSLELYKITDEHLAELEPKVGNNKQIYHVLPLAYQEAETENPSFDDLKEDFFGERMGYLHGVSIQDQVKPGEDEPEGVSREDALNIVPSDSVLEWKDILRDVTAPDYPNKVTADNLYAFGFTGKKYIPPESDGDGDAVSLAALESSMDEAKFQNYFIWDGTVVDEAGTREDPLEDGYYVIVLTSKEEPFWQYNSFLAFQQKADDVARFDAEHYNEPEMMAHEYTRTVDPVDLFTGAFTWDYTDMSLFGKHDLPFTRYYNSIDAGRNYGLGKGWSTEYTADLYLQPLFAQASLPNGRQLNFNINYDGSYQDNGDYTLAWNGSGYTLTNTHTLDTYQFDADGNIQQLVHPDGDVIRYSYTGGRLASISNGSGTFTLEYNGDGNISKVTDSVGRSITMSYDGDRFTAVENPDRDSLRYTYDDNGYLTTVSNFNGQVYVQNTYNADGQVIHQYAAEIGDFDFTCGLNTADENYSG